MRPGIYRGLPNAAYHGGPGISKSGLDLIRKSPAHYRAVVTAANDNERRPTAAQALGTALHMLVLEPSEFAKEYTLAPSRSDAPDAIDDATVLVTMIEALNVDRKPKLATGGSKAELVDRIVAEEAESLPEDLRHQRSELDSMKGAELKAIIEKTNEGRTGLLSVSGSRHDLAQRLRDNGVPVLLWSDYMAEWHQNNAGRQILAPEQFEQLRNMRDAVMAHPAAAKLLNAPGEAELSAYWNEMVRDQETGEVIGEKLCRVRPDYWRKDGIVVDLKSCEDASEEEFARSIAKWGYHVQDSYYRGGLAEAILQGGPSVLEYNPSDGSFTEAEPVDFAPPRAFVFIAVEKTACVVDGQAKGVAVYTLDEESQALGQLTWWGALASYTRCEMSGVWPGYSPKIRQIKLPAWQFTKAAAQAAAAE